MSTLSQVIKRLRRAEEEATQAFFDAVEKEAIRAGLTEVKFLGWGDTYLRGDKEVPNKKIDSLHERFCEEVSNLGLMGIWEAGKGWL